jgi:hypothetical protein
MHKYKSNEINQRGKDKDDSRSLSLSLSLSVGSPKRIRCEVKRNIGK